VNLIANQDKPERYRHGAPFCSLNGGVPIVVAAMICGSGVQVAKRTGSILVAHGAMQVVRHHSVNLGAHVPCWRDCLASRLWWVELPSSPPT